MDPYHYADHHAATPLLPEARLAMVRAHEVGWANPASPHQAGRAARSVLEASRAAVADALAVTPNEVLLTSGGTEACNLGVRGLAEGVSRVVVGAAEHPAVMQAAKFLASSGVELCTLPVTDGTPMSVEELRPKLDETTLLAVQSVNHETGTVFPVHEYAALCEAVGARLFVDASQAMGKVEMPVPEGAHAAAIAACKFGGPPGAGALIVRRGVHLEPLLVGGGQERGLRPGAPDLAAHAGFAAALRGLPERLAAQPRIGRFRDALEAVLCDAGAVVNGIPADVGRAVPRVATVTNCSVRGWRGEVLVAALDLEGVCVAAGAACSSGVSEPSPVLLAMHPDAPWRASSALRVSLGLETSQETVDAVSSALSRVLSRKAPQTPS